jgi:hypothetical protein
VSLVSQLREVLHRLLANEDSTSDRRLIQAGLLKGDVVFAESDQNIVVSGEASGIIVSGNQNRVVVQLTEACYQAIRDKLFPAPAGIPRGALYRIPKLWPLHTVSSPASSGED